MRFGRAERLQVMESMAVGVPRAAVTDQAIKPPVEPAGARRTVSDAHAQHATALVGFGRRLGLTEDEAWDAVQEAHVRLWRVLCAGEIVTNPRAWLGTAVYRLAMDQHRLARRAAELRRRLLPGAAAGAHAGGFGAQAHDATDRLAAWTAVDALPVRQRAAIYLHYRLDLPYEEVGRAMGISSGAARVYASRGLATVRAELGVPPAEVD